MTQTVFQRRCGGLFSISQEAIIQMAVFQQKKISDYEAGGVLLGRHIVDSPDVVVDQITVPTATDKRSRFRFFRSRNPHQVAIDKAWNESSGTCNYLGEWHTHPEADPTPSSIDLSDWKSRLKKDFVDADGVFFVILGLQSISAFEGKRATLAIERLGRLS